MSVNVVGYAKLMGADEKGTLAWEDPFSVRQLLQPVVERVAEAS